RIDTLENVRGARCDWTVGPVYLRERGGDLGHVALPSADHALPTAKLVGCVVGREDVHAVGGCPYHLSRARLDVTRADSDKFEGVGGVECAGTGRPGSVV